MSYRVTAAAVVVKVSDQRRQVYVYRGAILPPTLAEGEAARLLKRGMIVEVGARPAPTPEVPVEDPVVESEVPVEDPVVESEVPALDGMTVEQLKAHLTARGIPFDGVTLKADLLALAQQ